MLVLTRKNDFSDFLNCIYILLLQNNFGDIKGTMNVLSFNENLLERLLLLLQNNFGNDSNISKKTRNCLKLKTNFILVEQKLPPLCSCSFDNDDNTSKWIILCAKKQLSDDENCKEYFADILRQMMSKVILIV